MAVCCLLLAPTAVSTNDCNIGRQNKEGGGSKQLHHRWTKAYFLFYSSFILLLFPLLNTFSLLLSKSFSTFYSANLAPSITQECVCRYFFFYCVLFCKGENVKPDFFNFSNNCSESTGWSKGGNKPPRFATRIAWASSCFWIHSHPEACDWLRDHYPQGARAGHLVAARGLSRLITTGQPTPLNRFCWQNNVFLCHCAPSCVGMCVCVCVCTVEKR